MHDFSRRIVQLLSSKAFFISIIVVFILQALWLALSADYPMAFDEGFHVGVIRIYAEQWSPILTAQPVGSETFGALLSDPSYLYHYLMSFPYRIITVLTSNEAAQVIILRLMNIGLFVAALVLFRRVMLRALSPALTHISLAAMTLIPVVPFLAAQVNYDNALMLIVALLSWLALKIIEDSKRRRLDSVRLSVFVAVAAAGCLVKYTLLPIVAAAVLFLAVYICIQFRGHWRSAGKSITGTWRRASRPLKVSICVMLVISCGLFLQKFSTNLVRYGALLPKCHSVLTEKQCTAFGPYGRNLLLAQSKGYVDPNPFAYTVTWTRDLTKRLFFAISGPENKYANIRPLPLPMVGAAVVVVAGLLCLAWRPRLLKDPVLGICAAVVATYCVALWLDNYGQYLETGAYVAINGRYLIPLMPLMCMILGRAYVIAFADRVWLKITAAAVIAVCFLQGGGVMTYILRSDQNWHWHSTSVIRANEQAQTLLKPFIIEYGTEGRDNKR